ncbi:putative DNA mismatch repair protein MSH2 [Leptomonas pyrrhocoris]|uniref:Putative DNA mismatch repair protein MSH2 n=1 Tax=Leptomonas pyrrhocoris TaxID=157538 RepID=A0A0N0VE42_LEPPY|nr:putative DNA mismatch repair protein MSH2 [Leptomonas pyrrhocoris]KPA76782.1 putative DNA mismatch repair protein MSH2 [Leptomonas pyrrhocoris]|eukprot:XP_015655221.1 putative DNA mismatch repair protein MSH2 [Leptomonas pyrrhocoris]
MTDERDGGIVQTFLSLGTDSSQCLRLFSRGNNPGCYVLGWWATFAAKEYIKSTAVLKQWSTTASGSSAVDVVVVNDALCKEMIRDCLLRRGASVEFYERESAGGPYVCRQRGSPGNITDFEASLFEFEEAEIQLLASGSLVFGARQDTGVLVGFTALNTTLRLLSYTEYVDTPQLTSLDALVAQTNLKELLLTVTLPPAAAGGQPVLEEDDRIIAVRRICERCGVQLKVSTLREVRQQMKSEAAAKGLGALAEILRVPEERLTLDLCPLASHAVENILGRIDAMDVANQHAFYLRRIVPSTYMKLDSAAIEALNLVSKKPEPRGSLPTSVFSWLNRCHTGMGSRAMRQWLLQPLRSAEDINQRLNMVELFVESPVLRDMLVAQVLRRCGDMDRLNRRLQRRSLALKDTQAFLNFVNVVPAALQVLGTYTGSQSKLLKDEFIAPMEEINEHMANLKTLIEVTVDFSDRNAARMNSSFDDELQELHEQLTSTQKEIDREYAHVLRKYDWNEKQLKYEYHSTYGYVFRVSRKEDRQLRSSKELITVSTSKDGVRFVSEKMASLSEQYRRINDDYETRQQDLKRKLIDSIASYLPVLDDAKELIATLDVYVAWALVVKDSPRPMVRPAVRDTRATAAAPVVKKEEGSAGGALAAGALKTSGGAGPVLSFKNLRHPLVELRQPNFKANSLFLTEQANGLLITGPNMGGKSTFMRSVGVAVVLAQAGCFVPADAAEVQVRDAVMCRVGATDHLAQGVSTFMVEMLESAAILSGATQDTLAIVDELGRGTSTYDGFGLAWAIAQDVVVRVRATLLFSTHFHELTQLPLQCAAIQNAHFGADVDEAAGTLRFSYSLQPGPCGRSYGLYVAALANMPETVIARAKAKAAEWETFEKEGIRSGSSNNAPDATVVRAVSAYAKRLRELEQQAPSETRDAAVQRLKLEVLQNALVQPYLAEVS